MIVLCTKLISAVNSRNEKKQDGWVTVGKTYLVLGIYGRNIGIKYRILADNGTTPAFHDSDQFTVVSPKIPLGWIFRTYRDLEWELTPSAWSDFGFWEAYFDGDGSARLTFEKTVAAMMSEDHQ